MTEQTIGSFDAAFRSSLIRSAYFGLFAAVVLTFSFEVSAQDLPQKIRGYKVHRKIITIASDKPAQADRPYIVVGTPEIEDVSLGGVTLAIIGELEAAGYDGRVEKMTFHDFRVNGLAVEVHDYASPFTVNKRGKTKLPAPATVFLPTTKILQAAWKEIADSKDDWIVAGRVFVFGRFNKFGFSFRRVVPVDVRLVIKNPLLEYRKAVTS